MVTEEAKSPPRGGMKLFGLGREESNYLVGVWRKEGGAEGTSAQNMVVLDGQTRIKVK